MPASSSEYQTELFGLLSTEFGERYVCKKEWSIRTNATDAFEPNIYGPRLDLALGPFNVTPDRAVEDAAGIREAARQNWLVKQFVRRLESESQYAANPNPRCLLAIEIEFEVSSKHILGGFTNASMIGLIGVVIGPPNKIGKIRRIAAYARTLQLVGKAHSSLFGNLLCMETNEFRELLLSGPS